jgi:hypothetical protein
VFAPLTPDASTFFCAAIASADYCTSTSVQREPNRSLCTVHLIFPIDRWLYGTLGLFGEYRVAR